MSLSLVWQIVGVLAAFIVSYSYVRFKTAQHDKDIKEIKDNQSKEAKELKDDYTKKIDELERKSNSVFKKHDDTINRVTILEQKYKDLLSLKEAELKFITRKEHDLHLKNIELSSKHTESAVKDVSGKLDSLIELLSTNVVKTLSGGNVMRGETQ